MTIEQSGDTDFYLMSKQVRDEIIDHLGQLGNESAFFTN
jgi:hypothetical protein